MNTKIFGRIIRFAIIIVWMSTVNFQPELAIAKVISFPDSELKILKTLKTPQNQQSLEFYQISMKANVSKKFSEKSLQIIASPPHIFTEDFETSFPNPWQVYDGWMGVFGGPTWGVVDDPDRAGNHVAWCAGSSDWLWQQRQYPPNCYSIMVWGPVDLSRYSMAKISFSYKINIDKGKDMLCWAVSTDNKIFDGIGVTGNSEGWREEHFDLINDTEITSLAGQDSVWIAFSFMSDAEADSGLQGAFLDDIFLNVTSNDTTEEQKLSIMQVNSSGFPEISLNVTVVDSNHCGDNLDESHFTILESGFVQSVDSCYSLRSKNHVNVVLALDYSQSMENAGAIDHMQNAALAFVDSMQAGDKAAILKFAIDYQIVQDMTTDTSALKSAIRNKNFEIQNGTSFLKVIYESVEIVAPETGTCAVVVVTDGNNSQAPEKELDEVIDLAKLKDVSIYTIGLGDLGDSDTLSTIAEGSGGIYFDSQCSEDLMSIYETISQLLVNQYRLVYTTNHPEIDGRTREITVFAEKGLYQGHDTKSYTAPLIQFSFPDFCRGASGSEPSIPIRTTDPLLGDIYAIYLKCYFDPNVLEFESANKMFCITPGWQNPITYLKNDTLHIALFGEQKLSKAGPLVNLKFLVRGGVGDSTDLVLTSAFCNEGSPVVQRVNGSFIVSDEEISINGKIGYWEDFEKRPVKDVALQLSNNQMVSTNNSGIYSFSKLMPGLDYTVIPSFNEAETDLIDGQDASLALQAAFGLTELSFFQKVAADVNGDNLITAFDAWTILRFSVGHIDSFPGNNLWKFVPGDHIPDPEFWYDYPESLEYKELNRTLDNQDFTAILLGDVDGNWYPDQSSKADKNSKLTLSQMLDSQISCLNEKIILNSSFKHQQEIHSFGFTIKIPGKTVSGCKLINPESTDSFLILSNITEEGVRVVGAGLPEKITKPISVELEVSDSGSDISEVLISGFSMNGRYFAEEATVENILATDELPDQFGLSPNYPNPFNQQTVIKYQLPEKCNIKIQIFNVLGQKVATLLDKTMPAGYHQISWPGLNDAGEILPSGLYFCRMQGKNFHKIQKMALLK